MQWSLGFQRELSGSMSLDATYFGPSGVHLRRLADKQHASRASSRTPQPRASVPEVRSIQVMSAPGIRGCHALLSEAAGRASRGSVSLSSFSWSKSIDNGSGVRTSDGDSLTRLDNYDLGLERGLSALDFRRRWTNSWLLGSADRRGQAMC